jgi:hypothetical protein
VPAGKAIEERTHSGHHALARSRLFDLVAQVLEIDFSKACAFGRRRRDTMRRHRVRQDPRVRPAGHVDVLERVGNREDVFERARHGPLASAPGEHKRAVDVEKEDLGHVRKPILSPDFRTPIASVADC